MGGTPQSGRRPSKPPTSMSLKAAREGCARIAENIEELARNADYLLAFNEELMDRRIAWILVVHAIDETGKLVMIMKESAAAELHKTDKVTISGLYSHATKGSEAGKAGLMALDMFEEVIAQMARDVERDGFNIQRYRNHLETIRANFSGERSGALYAVFTDGQWLPPTCAHEDDIYIDAWILNLMAFIVRINLERGKSFLEVDKIVQKIMNSSKLLIAEWKKGLSPAAIPAD